MAETLVAFLTASILLTISPGPDIIYVLVQGMSNGKKAGIITALGLVSGIIIHTSLVAFGVSAIIKASAAIFFIIRILGALYLFYLAWKVFKSSGEIELNTGGANRNKYWALFKRGFIMNVLNPKVTIFFLAFLPAFLWDTSAGFVAQFFILGFLFMLQAFLIFSLVALLAGKITIYLKSHPSSGLILKWLQVVVFVGIGIFILF